MAVGLVLILALLHVLAGWTALASPYVGELRGYAGSSVPSGWLVCDGAAVSRSQYSTLFSAIGTTYGAGDGSSTFNLPDLRGRIPIGTGRGAGLTQRTLGERLGEEAHPLVLNEFPNHNHGGRTGISNADHGHSSDFPIYSLDNGGDSSNINAWTGKDGVRGYVRHSTDTQDMYHDHGVSSEGSGGWKNVIQPSLVINFIILFQLPSVVTPLHGEVRPNAGVIPSNHWLSCNGSAVSRTAFSSLFAVIGTTFGSGDGITTFNLPDLRGRSPMGAGAGAGLTPRSVGAQLGEEQHVLTTYEMPTHNHVGGTGGTWLTHSHASSFPIHTAENGPDSGRINAWTGNTAAQIRGYVRYTTGSAGANHQHSIPYQGSGMPHNVMQPSTVIHYVIRA
jgi:microcystin-dependent protein